MARRTKDLSPLEISRLSEAGYHHVGNVAGLVLQITKTGYKSWLLRAMVGGKRREIGLGPYPSVTLAGAKEAARTMREKITAGIDPVAERQATRSALAAAIAAALTFEQAAKKCIAAKEAGWKNQKHGAQWSATLEKYAYPIIGNLNVEHIETSHVLAVLEPIWTTKTETASRVRGRIETVLDWAKARGHRKGENPARWKGHLDNLLAKRSDVAKIDHHPALDYREAGKFMATLREVDGIGARALEFAILCASRSNEVRGATWSEIDEQAGIWIISPDRMKAKKEHRVPLSKAAVTLLSKMPRFAETDLIFPSTRATPLSDMTLTAAIRRMHDAEIKAGGTGWTDSAGKIVTAHGFRSTFRDWAGETTAYPREVIEHALAHQLADKAEAAYQRGDLLEKRRSLMKAWADYCSKPIHAANDNVTPLNPKVSNA